MEYWWCILMHFIVFVLELISFYAERFGMDEEQAVAIMGAHTLGGADTENSGYKVCICGFVLTKLNLMKIREGIKGLILS